MAGIMIYSAKDNLALELLSAARALAATSGDEIKALTVNNDSQAQMLSAAGADVYTINSSGLVPADIGAMADSMAQAVKKMEDNVVLLSSDRSGKELAGSLAQAIGAGCITDV